MANRNEGTAISQRLRALAIVAFYKIHKNRHKDVPGKWHPNGITKEGERKWKDVPLAWLYSKLQEESDELYRAARLSGNPHENAYLEAGDVTAMAMMLADVADMLPPYDEVPKVVCLCGSTKFRKEFEEVNREETLSGNIVLSVGFFMHSDDTLKITEGQKYQLDQLHLNKIDLADEVLVINVGGYIGESTQREIAHARLTGKPVRYLEPWNTREYERTLTQKDP